ncbi:nucleoside monophosphate kinase [Patescibacteria group bacterium]|nr:nucleoside monophosphate kinase [Patescibacteria group bacterium]
MKFNTIIFIGPQGSGKGTQAKMLSDKTGAIVIETGELCREAAKQNTPFGQHIKELVDNGVLVSDEDIQHLVHEKLSQLAGDVSVIFDGIPRRQGQAVFLFENLEEVGRKDIATIYVTLPREESLKRLQTRRICESCKTPAIFSGDEKQACAKCGGKLVTRADDNAEAINKRLDMYQQETTPVLDFLRQNSQFFEINGNQPIEKVSSEINNSLGV